MKEVFVKPDNKPDKEKEKEKEDKEKEKSKIDGLNYLLEYVPKISTDNIYIPSSEFVDDEYRTIIK